MRRTLTPLLALVSLMLVLFGSTPAAANAYPGLVEANYSRTVSPSGDTYTLNARIAVEVTDDGTQGRLRFHLQCFRTDADTGGTSANGCDFYFGSGNNAFWCYGNPSPTTCVGRDLDDRQNSADETWVGSWHSLSAGTSYKVRVDEFRVVFNNGNGPDGSWHDLSSRVHTRPPRRPSGLSDLENVFGGHCNAAANDARAFFPWANDSSSGGYIYFHPYIAGVVANIRNKNAADDTDGAYNRAVWGYACRTIAGSSNWSTHAYGAAIDINSVRNPQGDSTWDGVGSDGHNYGTYLPSIWESSLIGHFYWGINFSSNPDPMHFQYVTGY